MRLMIPVLSIFFSGLKGLAIVLASPVTIVCCAGLLLFTYKIAEDLKDEKRRNKPGPPVDQAPTVWQGLRA